MHWSPCLHKQIPVTGSSLTSYLLQVVSNWQTKARRAQPIICWFTANPFKGVEEKSPESTGQCCPAGVALSPPDSRNAWWHFPKQCAKQPPPKRGQTTEPHGWPELFGEDPVRITRVTVYLFKPNTPRATWAWLKIKQEGQTAGFGPCFHLPGFHFGTFFFF